MKMSISGLRCKYRIILVIFGGFLIHVALGALYTIGNLSPYVISYLRNRTEDETLKNVDTFWLYGAGSIGNCLGLTIGGLNAHRFGDRVAVLIGTVVFCGSTAMNYFSVQKSYIAWIFTQGLVGYFGQKLTYGVPIQIAINWLPNHASLATGLILSGTGGGSIILNQIITAYVNPNNLSPDFIDEDGERYFTQGDVLDKVPTCFVILGAIYFGLQLLGLAFTSEPPTSKVHIRNTEAGGINDDGDVKHEVQLVQFALLERQDANNDCKEFVGNLDKDKDNNKVGAEKESDCKITIIKRHHDDPETLGILQAIKQSLTSRSFYVIWLAVFCMSFANNFTTGLYKAYGQTFIADDHFLALVGSIAAVFNCFGRPLWGFVMDKAGFRVAIRCISGGFAVFSGTLHLTEKLPKELFLVWICAIYFFFVGLWSLLPSTLAKMLGPQHMSINYGFIYTGLLWASHVIFQAVAYIIGGTVGTPVKASMGWHGLYYIGTGLSCLVFLISFLFNGVDRSGKRI